MQYPPCPPHLTPPAVVSLPPPGLTGPSHPIFAPQSSRYLAFIQVVQQQQQQQQQHSNRMGGNTPVYAPLTGNKNKMKNHSNPQQQQHYSTTTSTERVLMCLDMEQIQSTTASTTAANHRTLAAPLLRWTTGGRSSSKRRILDTTTTTTTTTTSSSNTPTTLSLEERLRRERQRLGSGGSSVTHFSWVWLNSTESTSVAQAETQQPPVLRLLIPSRGSLHIQDGVAATSQSSARCLHDKALTHVVAAGAAIDPQLSPDGTMVAWTCEGELFCKSATQSPDDPAIQLTFGATNNSNTTTDDNDDTCISHGVADFVAQEEMDRYRGFWWHPDSHAILCTRTDESQVPLYRIMHQEGGSGVPDVSTSSTSTTTSSSSTAKPKRPLSNNSGATAHEDHRYPFAGKENPTVKLGFIPIDRHSILQPPPSCSNNNNNNTETRDDDSDNDDMQLPTAQDIAAEQWNECVAWIDPPREASEYLARVYWLPDGSACAQWQNRHQTVSLLQRIPFPTLSSAPSKPRTLLLERSPTWINLHHMFYCLPRPIHPRECSGINQTSSHTTTNATTIPKPNLPWPLPPGSFSFLWASEQPTGFAHLYLYTYVPGIYNEQAVLIKPITGGQDWMVEHIVGVDMDKDVVYCTGTYDSPLERHLYVVPLLRNDRHEEEEEQQQQQEYNGGTLADTSVMNDYNSNGVRRGLSKVMHALQGKLPSHNTNNNNSNAAASQLAHPVRLTVDNGMHNVTMDDQCRYFVDTSSDLTRPTTVQIFEISPERPIFTTQQQRQEDNGEDDASHHVRLVVDMYDAMRDDKALNSLLATAKGNFASPAERLHQLLPPPEFLSFPTSDGTETLHAALYRPDPGKHGPGPYPLVCAVYGGPHVQRVNRAWSQSADLRAQRLRSLGFCVVKCDNRGSSRRGTAFESAIARQLGKLEVLDQVAVVRQLVVRGVADASRVGVYGWSYGGYLAAMCLCRAPDVFHVAVAGAPVTSWDGYDTHYTERYMGLPRENLAGYRESAVFDHIPNMQGKLMLVHGLIDENVHFRHTARLINKLIAAGKDYDLLIFPEERHSPRRLRDRIYMEQRISDYFVRHLGVVQTPTALDLLASLGPSGLRTMAGHL